nr:hypothetical protein [Tanacetum cinerariifolium]
MLPICPKLPGQKFEDLLFEKEILSFIRDLSHIGEIKVLTDIKVNYMHQTWRLFSSIINRCLSGKTIGLDSLCLSRTQIIWGMYHKKNVDYVYLLWEELVYQVENKNSKKNNDMCYPRFTKVIIDYFMSKDQSISRRNKMFWHTARDDLMFNAIRVISRHQDTQIYGDILPDVLNEGTGTIPGVLDVPPYESESDKESWGDSKDEDDNDDDGDNDDDVESDNHDDDSDDERTRSNSDGIPDPNLTNVDQTEYEEEDVDE